MSSYNLKRKMYHLTTIEDWDMYKIGSASALSLLFNQVFGENNIFQSIYVAIRNNPQNETEEATETYTYYNVGHTVEEIGYYFSLRYGLNYFAYMPNNTDDFNELKLKLKSIYDANEYTYRKLIESMGYRYNPINDLNELSLYSFAESLGDSNTVKKPEGTIITTNNPTQKHFTQPYNDNESTSSRLEYYDSTEGNDVIQKFKDENGNEQYTETSDITHKPAFGYVYNQSTGQWVEGSPFSILAKDNAFGVAFTGPERYYAEKKIRQGQVGRNITQELLAKERNLVQFNILDVFFKHIEKELVVGIY